MTDSEAKTILERDFNCLKQNKALQDSIESMEIAINALENQIPKKPIIKQGKYCNSYHCPVCNGYIRSTNTRIEVILEENMFCGVCGQKLNWESDEK